MASGQTSAQAATTQAQAASRMYNERAASYEDSWHPAFVHDFLDRLSPPLAPGDKVLDLACGTGLVAFLAAARVGRHGLVHAVDISDGMLARAAARQQAGFYPHVRFYHHDIVNMDDLADVVKVRDEGGGFDLISCASAFVLLDDPFATLRYWANFLKPGGRLLLDVTHPQNKIAGLLSEKVGNTLGIPVPYHRTWVHGPESLRAVFEHAGVEVQSITIVPQDGGKERYITLQDAEAQWEYVGPPSWKQQVMQKGFEAKAKELFSQELSVLALDGRVKELDAVYVGVAIKPPGNHRLLPPLPTVATIQDKPDKPLFTGGCRCGGVRYSVFASPKNHFSYCHCFTCRHLGGGPFLPFIDFDPAAVQFEGIESLQGINISPHAQRSFCGKCGSPMTMRYRKESETIGIPAGTLDDQGIQDFDVPTDNIWLQEKASWYKLPDDGFARYQKMTSNELLTD